MSEPLLFMFFSTIETFSLYFLIMSLFRFKFQEHAWKALTVILLNNVQSWFLRNELDLSFLSPLLLVLIFIVFFVTVVKMPIIMSLIATVTGLVAFSVVQCIVVIILFGSLTPIHDKSYYAYIGQTSTALIVFVLFRLLYIKGKGFTFDIDRLRLAKDDVIFAVLLIASVIFISIVLILHQIYFVLLVFTLLTAYLLHCSYRKENEEPDL